MVGTASGQEKRFVSASKKKFHYTVAKVLHWVAAVMILFMLLSGWRLGEFPADVKHLLMMVHSGMGTTVFFLILFRWWWRSTHKLYSPPGWRRNAAMLMQWAFYPLLLAQAVIGVLQAAFIDYEIRAFGVINYSALAADNEALQRLFHQVHVLIAVVLILLVVLHAMEKSRSAFVNDSNYLKQ